MANRRRWVPRDARQEDRRLVDSLLAGARWRHAHLDWLEAADLLGQSPFLLATEEGIPTACLACPPDPPGIAWIRVFACTSRLSPTVAWTELWPIAAREAARLGAATAAALTAEPWMASLLGRSGFEEVNRVVFLEHRGPCPVPSLPPGASIRPSLPRDLDALLTLDQRAFAGLWAYSSPVLGAALEQAALVTVLEVEGEMIGYQLSTASALGAHLARLAVDPRQQGQGFGRALVEHLLHAFSLRGFERVSVNTQADNHASLSLYRRLGFLDTGQSYPVYTAALDGTEGPGIP